jgi:hypothetical protein
MIKGKLSILILSLCALTGPANSAWAQRDPSPQPTTTRVPEPATGVLLLAGLAGGLAIRRLRKRSSR